MIPVGFSENTSTFAVLRCLEVDLTGIAGVADVTIIQRGV